VPPNRPLPIEVRSDPAAAPGDLASAIAHLLLVRARRTVAQKRTDDEAELVILHQRQEPGGSGS
jgi:hypothetical protein